MTFLPKAKVDVLLYYHIQSIFYNDSKLSANNKTNKDNDITYNLQGPQLNGAPKWVDGQDCQKNNTPGHCSKLLLWPVAMFQD